MDNGGVSVGEAGGVLAGVIALLAAMGKSFKELINWKDAREKSRAAELKAWEDSLARREKENRERTEDRLEAVESKLSLVTGALFDALGELHRLDPASPVLARAKQALQQAYPLDVDTPPDIQALVRRIDREKGDVK